MQAAIDAAAVAGGAAVVFPPGRYLTGTLVLRSGLTLHLEKGAVLLGSTEPRDYRGVTATSVADETKKRDSWDSQTRYLALLVASGAEGITLRGEGAIDGQGATLMANIRVHFPQLAPTEIDESARPALINFVACCNVRILDLTFRSPACWTQVYTDCDDLQFRGLTVRGHAFWNNDGIDLCDCRNVIIADCNIDVADDGICLKSGQNPVEPNTLEWIHWEEINKRTPRPKHATS